MKFIPNSVSRKVARQVLLGRKHSPTVLFGVGVVGIVATTVTACRATLKVEEILASANKDTADANELATRELPNYTESDLATDLAHIKVRTGMALVKLYAPSVVLGTLTIAALTGSHHIMSNRNASLAAAYAAVDKGYREYRQRVTTELGEDKDREFAHGVEVCEIVDEDSKGGKITHENRASGGSVYSKLFDRDTSKSWQPRADFNEVFIRSQQNYANEMLQARGHMFLNEVYDMLGLERTTEAQLVGWVWDDEGDGDGYIDFGIFNALPNQSEQRRDSIRRFMRGDENAVWLDFNVDGPIYELISKKKV